MRDKTTPAHSEVPPNEHLKRHPDEAYGDTDVPAQQRHDSAAHPERKKQKPAKSRKRKAR